MTIARPMLLLATGLAGVVLSVPAAAATYVSTVVATGLNNPRGLAFGPDGGLYIAEAGTVQIGPASTVVIRGGVPHTFYYSTTGSITRLFGGMQERVITGLPSIGSPTIAETTGPQDIAFGSDGTGYFVTGFITDPALRFSDLAPNGGGLGSLFTFSGTTVTKLADIAVLETASNPAGRELNANPFRVAATGDGVLVVDAGSNTLIDVGLDGTTSLLATFFARDMGAGFPSDSVPTGVAIGPDGNYYVAELTGFPFVQGSAQIHRVTPTGEVTLGVFTGFTNLIDIAFGADGSLYALEFDSNGITTGGPGGALIRLGMDGTRQTIFNQGLIAPTGLEIGKDGAFYITALGTQEGIGQVLRISAVPEPGTWALLIAGFGFMGAAMRQRRRTMVRFA